MGAARVLSAAATALAVGGCAVVAVTMARSDPAPRRVADREPLPTTSISRTLPGYRVITPVAPTPSSPSSPSSASSSSVVPSSVLPSSSAVTSSRATSTAASSSPPVSTSRPAPSSSHTSAARTSSAAPTRTSTSSHPAPPRTTSSSPKPKPKPSGQSLPLPNFTVGNATRVVTVVASSTSSTTATLQAWDKAPGWGWFKHGPAVTAHVGSDGLTRDPSEWKSATPIGSFTLTRAFGRYSDPGTPLPYTQTTPSDWWISQSGSLYNTFQRCSSGCGFTQGSPNEHLYYETPYYNYAVVIDYNTRNAGTVRQGAGSAFFLHVSVGSATAGCVAVPQDYLVALMRWLSPSAHPRILIGAP